MKLISYIFNDSSTTAQTLRSILWGAVSTYLISDLTAVINHPELFSAPMVLGATFVLTTVNNLFATKVKNI